MENPYYEIIGLMRQAAAGHEGVFSADVILDADTEAPVVVVDGQPLEGDVWLAQGMELTAEDEGAALLCVPFDRGFFVAARLQKME